MHNFTPFFWSRKPSDTKNDEMLWLRGKLLIDSSTWNCHCDPCSTAPHPHQEHLSGTREGLLRRTITYAEVHTAPTVQVGMFIQRPKRFIIDRSVQCVSSSMMRKQKFADISYWADSGRITANLLQKPQKCCRVKQRRIVKQARLHFSWPTN